MTSSRRQYKTCLPNEEQTPYILIESNMTTESKIEKINVTLPNNKDSGKLAFILLNVFTKEECLEWIELTENRGYKPALVNVGTHEVLMTDFRNNDRCIIDDVDMAKKLFERLRPYLPEIWEEHQIVGLNERLRFLRYDPGQKFERHMDGVYRRSDQSGERSFITIQLYLNEGYEGGETTFISFDRPEKDVRCKPRTGMVLIFEHQIYHEGSALQKGRKYTVRTDVMYRPTTASKTNDI